VTIFVTVLHILVCLILIVVVLLQRGKGAEIGAVFGGGGGDTMFGARGAGNFMTRLTSGSAVIFMLTSLTLAYFAQDSSRSTLFEGNPAVEESSPFEEVAPGDAEPTTDDAAAGFEEVVPAEADANEVVPAPEAGAVAKPDAADAAGAPEADETP
jgi:preprotein translocase subunit SecG